MRAATAPVPSAYDATRSALHRVATHLLARRRFDATGRFGLRASPGGFTTPAFGPGPEAVRVSGTTLVRDVGGVSQSAEIAGSTLGDLAAFTGVDLEAEFTCGDDTPALGAIDAALDLDAEAVRILAAWYDLAWQVLDAVVAGLPAAATPVTIQLWPEHFDAGTNVGLAFGERVNLGFSPGDAYEPEPYAYVGPRSSRRPGDAAYWNAPFGAVLRRSDAGASAEAAAVCRQFMRTGLRHLDGP